ncbi:hypothetical protein GJ689_19375 [Rhodoplanes serenus]|uniref:Dynamin family protein n=1 Tax=Rhodoplanes serenus TaxID=200615 RepID=A0A9X4XPG1_9BRAD|nr:MIT C-terminal domain-containing protein [Rhodoplanes serenus]MTW18367.1 hypothetical protein [Rhodoplanes serenus]
MKTKSPRRIRQSLEAARDRVARLIGVLRQHETEKRWGLGEECAKAANGLERLLNENAVPQDYKVAVIGRFKAGKSAFVNELLGRRLAGEDTSPETAAITTFRAGDGVVAKINLVDKETWDALKALHEKDPTDPESQRVVNWLRFIANDGRQNPGGQAELFDLDAIEREHLKPGGHTLTITLSAAATADDIRKAENEFRRRIRQYTTGSKPHHCLVESIEIESPSTILGEGVTLVDTPGLDDTERFRVQLTERAVQDVDAVLFLTKSGAAYGQSEKDFLLSLLRKGTVKQLVFVVTQVDQTYEQHVRQARDQDEDPEPIVDRIEAERRRIRLEVEATLDELAGDAGSVAAARYREQLNAIEIAFTSAANHRDHMRGEAVKFPISPGDAGGMRSVKDTLFRILSTESRLAATAKTVQSGAASVLQDMLSVVDKRRAVVAGLKDREVAEQKLATFRTGFERIGELFVTAARQDIDVLNTSLGNRSETGQLIAEIVAQQADNVLASYETEDAAIHWRTRRGGRWGYMHELQTRVANRIFPRVAEQLTKQTSDFGRFVDGFRAHLQSLSDEAGLAIERLEIGDELQLDIGASLEAFLQETLEALQEIVEGEETRIVALLEEFVDEQVEEKIAAARDRVAGILGRGTSVAQTAEIRNFYREVRGILRGAVQNHVRRRFDGFAAHLQAQAEALPDRTLTQVRSQIQRASADIRAAAEAAIAGQKEAFEQIATRLMAEINGAQSDISGHFFEEAAPASAPEGEQLEPPILPASTSNATGLNGTPASMAGQFRDDPSDGRDPPSDIRRRATHCVQRYILRNGDKSWPFSRMLTKEYLAGASEAWLIDPYLAQRHQRRNLLEFVMALLDRAKPKTLHIITREQAEPAPDADKEFYDSLDRQAFEKAGMRVKHFIEVNIHDRYLILDNGIVFKLGRGLDIYKPVAGLASRDPALRQVRECEVDVFSPRVSDMSR